MQIKPAYIHAPPGFPLAWKRLLEKRLREIARMMEANKAHPEVEAKSKPLPSAAAAASASASAPAPAPAAAAAAAATASDGKGEPERPAAKRRFNIAVIGADRAGVTRFIQTMCTALQDECGAVLVPSTGRTTVLTCTKTGTELHHAVACSTPLCCAVLRRDVLMC